MNSLWNVMSLVHVDMHSLWTADIAIFCRWLLASVPSLTEIGQGRWEQSNHVCRSIEVLRFYKWIGMIEELINAQIFQPALLHCDSS